jgi:hypothetical protein
MAVMVGYYYVVLLLYHSCSIRVFRCCMHADTL